VWSGRRKRDPSPARRASGHVRPPLGLRRGGLGRRGVRLDDIWRLVDKIEPVEADELAEVPPTWEGRARSWQSTVAVRRPPGGTGGSLSTLRAKASAAMFPSRRIRPRRRRSSTPSRRDDQGDNRRPDPPGGGWAPPGPLSRTNGSQYPALPESTPEERPQAPGWVTPVGLPVAPIGPAVPTPSASVGSPHSSVSSRR